jgi:DNA-binding LacI/PurR family transcriptional regulator
MAWLQASGSTPPLTTIEQPIGEIVDTAVSALRRLIDEPGDTVPSYVFRPRLREGGTTVAPAA